MSKQNEIEVVDGGRSVEPWFAVLLSSLVPLVVAVMLPESWRMPLYGVGGLLCVIGVGLLIKRGA
jgi:hypothetical protein